jgi:hypothetical protein
MSAPRSSGFCRYGEANVLSTHNKAPAGADILATAAMSVMFINGFVGVSIHISFVLPVIAFLILSTLVVSTYLNTMPNFSNTFVNNL